MVRVPDREGGDRAWLVLGDRSPASTDSRLTVAEVRNDGSIGIRVTEMNGPFNQPQRFVVGLFGDWLLSRLSSAVTLGLPVASALPERVLAPTGTFLPQRAATQVNRFWFDFQDSRGILELRDADGNLVQEATGVIPVRYADDWQGLGDELLVLRPGAAGSIDLLGLDPGTGAVRTLYGPLTGARDGPPLFLDAPRMGQVVLFTGPSSAGIGRQTLSAIRIGTPGVRVLASPSP